MNWNSLGEFLAMGGYGLYVWGSVWVVLGAIAIEVLSLVLGRRAALKRLGAGR